MRDIPFFRHDGGPTGLGGDVGVLGLKRISGAH